MKSPFSIIGIAAAISIGALIMIDALPDLLLGLAGNDWLTLMIGAAAAAILMLTQTYTMSARIASGQRAVQP
ncbi:MAG: hypothetical protein QM743_00910 [Chitinophagaceae bacterium]